MTKNNKSIEKDGSQPRILEAATKLFVQKGYYGTGIREICEEAGANVCMISYFWKGKEGLYSGILENLIKTQTDYIKKFIDINAPIKTLTKDEQIELLFTFADKLIDYVYQNKITSEKIYFILTEQQNVKMNLKSPIYTYLRKLLGEIFEQDYNDKEIIYKALFIVSQIYSAAIMPVFSLKIMKQTGFKKTDADIIKENIRFYIDAILKEVKK